MITPDRDPAPDTGCPPLGDDEVRVVVDAEHGGRIAQISVRGVDLLIGREAAGGDPMRWGSYPMVPWAGRIRHGRFSFGGTLHQLPIESDGHAIHGVGFVSPWTVTGCTSAVAELTLALPSDGPWPFGGHARQRITVTRAGRHHEVSLELEVTAGEVAMPAMVGWHPWFRKPERLGFRPGAMYRRVDGIADGELVDVSPGPWDDCFVNTEPVLVTIAGVTARLTSDCTDWVVFDERPEATCIEPQSGPPDSFNTMPRVLAPHESLHRWFRLRLAG
jgi:aldose 1-epimerase